MDEDFISSFMTVSGLSKEDIVLRCCSSALENQTLLNFYIFYGRWPTEAEADFIFHIGFHNFQAIYDRGVMPA